MSEECPIHENYKKAVLKAKDRDTVVTGRSVDAPVRCLRNQMTNAYIAKEKEGADRMELEHFTLGGLRKAVFDGDVKTGKRHWPAGGGHASRNQAPAADL